MKQKILLFVSFLVIFSQNSFSQNWNEVQKVLPSPYTNQMNGLRFGSCVAIDGDYAVIGAYGYMGSQGIAHVLHFNGVEWETIAALTASNSFDNSFGSSVAIDGDVIIIGAGLANDVYLFKKPNIEWADMTETVILSPTNPANISFGISLAIDSNIIVIGAIGENIYSEASGAAYIFEEPIGGWVSATETAKIIPSNGGNYEEFGASVDVDGNTIVVGTSAVNQSYVFEKPLGGWISGTETAILSKSGAYYGQPAKIYKNTIVIADNIYNGSEYIAKVFVFEKPLGGWVNMNETVTLTTSDNVVGSAPGNSYVDIYKNRIVLGVPKDTVNGYYSGSAYVYQKSGVNWANMTETDKLIPSDGDVQDFFGKSVAFNDDYILVSAFVKDDNFTDVGAAYFFKQTCNTIDNGITITNNTTLNANQNSATYQWYTCDGGLTAISGESNQSFTPQNYGLYSVEITVDTCSYFSDCFNFDIENTKENELTFKAYPNPVNTKLILELDHTLAPQITIYNTMGEVIYTVLSTKTKEILDFSDFPKGLYIIEVSTAHKKAIKQIVKM